MYKSPFLQPPKCNNQSEARDWPSLHSLWSHGCPVHKSGAPVVNDNWQRWAVYREAFTTIDGEENEAQRELFLILMLSQVTESIPPDAPYDYGIWMTTTTESELESARYNRSVWIAVAAAFVGFISLFMTGAALLGWL